MRFLCLHGMGTNSTIFEAQLAPIIANLDPSYEFVYVDGEIDCEPAEGVESLFSGPFYCYYDIPTADRLQAAFELIREVMEEDGPFDGIIGFSQGAALAASLLLDHQKNNPHGEDLFRMAIFTCASLPFDADSVEEEPSFRAIVCPETGVLRVQDDFGSNKVIESSKNSGYLIAASAPGVSILNRHHAKRTNDRISIPTLHIIGEEDPYMPQGRALVDLCVGNSSVVSHGLGHKLPRDTIFTRKAVSAMKAMISRARFQS